MFSTYNLVDFGRRMKEVRSAKGLSQREVCKLCGINKDTLRKLENGITIPRYDTLEILSQVYKTNILIILNEYKYANELTQLYNKADYLLRSNSLEEVINVCQEFESIQPCAFKAINATDVKQLELFFCALKLSYSDSIEKLKKSKKLLIQALNLTGIFSLSTDFTTNSYTSFELRILLLLGSVLGILRECVESNNILLFITKAIDSSEYASLYEKELIIKSHSIISYNYHRLDKHDKVLKHSEKGIELCLKYNLLTTLHFLLFRKGIAMYILQKNGFKYYLKQSLNLLLIQNDIAGYKEYKKNLEENYNIDLILYDATDFESSEILV